MTGPERYQQAERLLAAAEAGQLTGRAMAHRGQSLADRRADAAVGFGATQALTARAQVSALWPAVAPDPDPEAAIERATAHAAVAAWGIAAIWRAPTRQGACLRAALHLPATDPQLVREALTLWSLA